MKNKDYFKDKKVTVVGVARSGLTCANLLDELGAQVSVTDNQDNAATRLNAQELKSRRIKVELGVHTQEFIRGRDIVVISPGVPNTSPAIIMAEHSGIPVISEIEVASILCPATIIAVTGSNGKTTVTTLIGKVLEAQKKGVFVCGNIGNPFSGEVDKMQAGDYVCLEISSFQLERISSFKPKIALILNFTQNHLDRYRDMQEYLAAKKRIFLNQDKDDFLVLNADDPVCSGLAKETKAKAVYFSAQAQINPNQAAVLAVASILGIKKEACIDLFKEFRGVEHRMEDVMEINKVKFINDSKATTVDSAIWALKSASSPVILIAGGRDKGLDYSAIVALASEKVREVVLIGEARHKIAKAFAGKLIVEEAKSLEEAVVVAFQKAKAGDCILLSPMCSSFDMFTDYEERGRAFKKAVRELAKKKPL